MTELYKEKYRTTSTRLKGWDYSWAGWYFITICTGNREEFFGEVVNAKMELSKMGTIAHKFWKQIPEYFKTATLDEFIIMPNHLHGIVVLGDDNELCKNDVPRRDAILSRLYDENHKNNKSGGITGKHNPMLSKKSLSRIIRDYKSAVTRHFTKNNFNCDYFSWQPRFYDRIIRNEDELNRIREYIQTNPARWQEDRNNPKNLFM